MSHHDPVRDGREGEQPGTDPDDDPDLTDPGVPTDPRNPTG